MKGLVGLEAQDNKLFDSPEEAGTLYLAVSKPGTLFMHKKSTARQPMVYVSHGIFRETEPPHRTMIGYQALYLDDRASVYMKHSRPLDMFTTDRFLVLGHIDHFNRIYKGD